MFAKVITASVAGLLLTGSFVAPPASAAVKISNGVACAKSGATTKVKTTTYKCAKNPTVKNAKLTWVSKDCLDANTSWIKSNKDYQDLEAQMPATLADLDQKIVDEAANVVLQNIKADALDLQVKTMTDTVTALTAKREKLIADSANAIKNKPSITTYAQAITTFKKAIASLTASATLYRKTGKSVETMKKTREYAATQLGQAKSGVAQSLDMRSMICAKGL